MSSEIIKQTMENHLASAGIQINGNEPWDIKVHNEKFYRRVLFGGSLSLGESYMDGWWDCEALDQFFYKVLKSDLHEKIKVVKLHRQLSELLAGFVNWQRLSRAFVIGKRHYDTGNDLFTHMLDKRMVYSCGYWNNAQTLDQAQESKLELICKKIGLKSGQRVLDIGCGWGSFAKYAAEKYGAEVVGITVSKAQVELGRKLCKGLPVDIRLQDYRSLDEKFDHIVSVGMVEHVGPKNYKQYMQVVHRCLEPEGLFLLHTIGRNTSTWSVDPWISRYIFPDAVLPSAKQITSATEGLFVLEDWHSFGSDYDKTLMAWHHNFTSNWDEIKGNYDEQFYRDRTLKGWYRNFTSNWDKKGDYAQRFYRMWTYHLLSSAASSRSRDNQLWQIVFSKKGVEGGYKSIR